MSFLKSKSKWIFIISCIVGLGLSVYSLHHHYQVKTMGSSNAACNVSAVISCDVVASSEYSEFAGIPMGAYGFGFFLTALILYLNSIVKILPNIFSLGVFGQKSQNSDGQVLLLTLATGLVVSLILAFISLFKIGAVCLVCIGVYICTILLGLCFYFEYKKFLPLRGNDIFNGAFKALIIVILGIAVPARMSTPSTSVPQVTNTSNKSNTDNKLANNIFNIDISTSPYHGYGEDYRMGSDNAKVTIVEFADFQCPACRNMSMLLNSVKQKYGDQIRVVFKNFQLSSKCNDNMGGRNPHPFSCDIAAMARCAGLYGYFWDYHNLAFANQQKASQKAIQEWAEQVGLTKDQIEACEATSTIMDKIKDDARLAVKLNVQATPTVFINGKLFTGGSQAALEEIINQFL